MNIVPTADLDALEGVSCYRLSRPDADSRVGPDLWFATTVADLTNGRTQEAIQVCRKCKVQLACLNIALRNREPYGVWGGTTPEDRDASRRHPRRG